MKIDNNINSEFNEQLNNWLKQFKGQIDSIKNRNHIPIIVALSRKMPQFLKWLYNVKENDLKYLDEIEVITELALPFVYSRLDIDKYEFIIIDDVIIHGTTLKIVSSNIKQFTGKKPHISCIILHEKAIIPDTVDIKDTLMMSRFNQEKIDRFICDIADIIEKYCLPIDIEFPIFTKKIDLSESWSHINDIVKNTKLDYYKVDDDKSNSKLSILLDKIQIDKYEPDFEKIRFYYSHSNQIEFEIFAPTIINEYDLINNNLFTERFQEIWDKTTKQICKSISDFNQFDMVINSHIIKTSYIRTLCVWANYLLSLSFFIERVDNNDSIFEYLTKSFDLSNNNLKLLLGYELCESIFSDLQTLIREKIKIDYLQRLNLLVPDSIAPNLLSSNIDTEKGKLVILHKSLYKNILDGIIKFEHYTNPIFYQAQFTFKRMFFCETFDSFYKAISTFYNGNIYKVLNEWIDRRIDEGYLVPKYERVELDSNIVVWRRYFHAGVRRIV